MKTSTQFGLRVLVAFFVLSIVSVGSTFAGDPIPGVDVHLGKPPGPQVAMTARTDSTGKFTMIHVDTGSYAITFTAADGARMLQLSHSGQGAAIHMSINTAEGLFVNGSRQWGMIPISSKSTTVIVIRNNKRSNTIVGQITGYIP